MQSTFKKTLLASLVLFGLTACGSGGGGGSSAPTTSSNTNDNITVPNVSTPDTAWAPQLTNTSTQNTTSNQNNNSSTATSNVPKDGITGGMYTFNVAGGKLQSVTTKLKNTDINRIGLDATALQKSKNIIAKIDAQMKKEGVNNATHIAYAGLVGGNGRLYAFYNGSPTKTMPVSGTIYYLGHSGIYDVFADYENDYTIDDMLGEAEFTADLGKKTLTGTLRQSGFDTIKISANISGNSFTGKATASYTNADVEGKFYGDKAVGLAGILKTDANAINKTIATDGDENGIIGAFYGYDMSRIKGSGTVSAGTGVGGYTYGK